MIIKLSGVCFIMFCAYAAGSVKSHSLIARKNALQDVLKGIKMLKTRLLYSDFEIQTVLYESFFECECISLCGNKAYVCGNELKKEDTELLSQFFSLLGTSDRNSECERAKMYENLLSDRLCDAESEAKSGCRLIKTLSICIGLAVCILII
ncbi:MAG: stage III sporulation protein AB [Clostridia bacterium]|nr:stage III sporulation protein AB [Clostridia bacterium]